MFKKEIFERYIALGMPTNEAAAEFSLILDSLDISPVDEIKNGISDANKKRILDIVEKRVNTKAPLAHILEFSYFMGEKFFVDKNTLIPRPETEILVRLCSKYIDKSMKILDIGTGSGCIAIMLKMLTDAEVDGVDISKEAIKIAQKNAKKFNVECNFFESDLFSNVKSKYDFIISNPPYIPLKDLNTLDNEVKDFEPHNALFADDELGISFYEKIIEKSFTFLNKNGRIGFELGAGQSGHVKDLLSAHGFSDIEIIKDLNGIDRVIISKKLNK